MHEGNPPWQRPTGGANVTILHSDYKRPESI